MQAKFYAAALTALALSSTACAQDLKTHTYLADLYDDCVAIN